MYTRDSCNVFDLQRMGEYYSIIDSAEIDDPNGTRVWRAQASTGMRPQVHEIVVCAGDNPLRAVITGQPDAFEYESSGGGASWRLEPGKQYTFRVTSPDAWMAATVTFSVRRAAS